MICCYWALHAFEKFNGSLFGSKIARRVLLIHVGSICKYGSYREVLNKCIAASLGLSAVSAGIILSDHLEENMLCRRPFLTDYFTDHFGFL